MTTYLVRDSHNGWGYEEFTDRTEALAAAANLPCAECWRACDEHASGREPVIFLARSLDRESDDVYVRAVCFTCAPVMHARIAGAVAENAA